ncbi:glycosyltransferase family 4 protein [Spirosoma sp. SC4-14]|uniref:glycosyltransferase family 4 protein n=1 Tax=Spirosoma sp. SC4-14 TaxID=3128900 RepID=UPI0030CBD390
MDLATELSQLGHSIRVLTLTPAREPDAFSFEVVRKPGFWQTVRHIRWADAFVQFNISLKGILPYLFVQNPLVLTHHNLYPATSLTGRLKWAVSRRATVNMGCSKFIAQHYRNCYTLSNPYNDTVFIGQTNKQRSKELVFLGRLVSDKGVSVLLQSLAKLRQRTDLMPTLTIIGDGPERSLLEKQVHDLGLHQQVQFAGVLQGKTLVEELNQSQILLIPSVYEEPFGIVALEGIACGCFVIGSKAGGLPEAIGPCGVTFPMEDSDALADLLAKALQEPEWVEMYRQQARHHLEQHTRPIVAARFLTIIEEAVWKKKNY